MNKTFYTVEANLEFDDHYTTYQEAEDAAKRFTAQNRSVEYCVLQAVARVQAPMPEAEVTKLG